jgi:hypothetical protein
MEVFFFLVPLIILDNREFSAIFLYRIKYYIIFYRHLKLSPLKRTGHYVVIYVSALYLFIL